MSQGVQHYHHHSTDSRSSQGRQHGWWHSSATYSTPARLWWNQRAAVVAVPAVARGTTSVWPRAIVGHVVVSRQRSGWTVADWENERDCRVLRVNVAMMTDGQHHLAGLCWQPADDVTMMHSLAVVVPAALARNTWQHTLHHSITINSMYNNNPHDYVQWFNFTYRCQHEGLLLTVLEGCMVGRHCQRN